MEILIPLAFIFAIATAIVAVNKNRDPIMWFFIGLVSGIIGLVVIIALDKNKEA